MQPWSFKWSLNHILVSQQQAFGLFRSAPIQQLCNSSNMYCVKTVERIEIGYGRMGVNTVKCHTAFGALPCFGDYSTGLQGVLHRKWR